MMKHVLYVEDSGIARLLMRKCLSDLCDITMVSTLQAGFQALQEQQFDLLIADFVFPEGDALDLIEHARQSASWEKFPIIVVSSTMDRMLLNRVLKVGANEALPKPLITETFRALVERMLHDPYVRAPKDVVNGVSCFQWRANGLFHQYCPELNLAVSGATRSEAAQRMKALLKEHSEKGTPLGATSQEAVVVHMVHEAVTCPAS